ncbi:MAG: hypothetical protein HZA94_00825 [Candidatus Vogelbacteria bacterium]|nr:hypothetical protein [Candidatus Vogelbacteria bacterium]
MKFFDRDLMKYVAQFVFLLAFGIFFIFAAASLQPNDNIRAGVIDGR